MTTEEALLAAIWASPHDDLPRLVYADWLDETGDPAKAARAEFIRVQCELARVDDQTSGRWHTLKEIETRLWERHRDRFRRGMDNELANEPFQCGFVAPSRQVIGFDHLLNWPEEQLNRAPLWEFHVIFRPPARVVELTQSPRFRRLGFLGLWGMNDEQAVAVAESPQAVNLTGIHCRRGSLTLAGVLAIAQSPNLPHLTELILETKTLIDERFAWEFCRTPLGQRVKRLDLRYSPNIDGKAYLLLGSKIRGRVWLGEDRFK